MTRQTTYQSAGVNIDAGNEFVRRIKPLITQTKGPAVLSDLGGYAGLYSLANISLKNPVLVATTDGVGTKLKLAIEAGNLGGIGQDLVAMCVNDLLCCGATPLFFLDYYASGKLDLDQAEQLIASITAALKQADCALLGGETAEMPGLYQNRDFDLAGFAVGVVDKERIIDGSTVSPGHKIIGLAASGVHSNGFSLVRKIIRDHSLDLNKTYFSASSLAVELLEPTPIYVKPVLHLLKKFDIRAMAHITGGGLVENIPRVLPENCQARIHAAKIGTPKVFHFLKEKGSVPDKEMWRVFNMGIGYVLVVPAGKETDILSELETLGVSARVIGLIETRDESAPAVTIC